MNEVTPFPGDYTMASIKIRNATNADLDDVMRINRDAFGQDEEADLVADAWMVLELKSGVIEKTEGKIRCADKLSRPELWRERG